MKNSLVSLGIATLLASGSNALLASSVTVPNDFTAGTAAVATQVNDNFTAVEGAVNDNDTRINTLVGQTLDGRITTLEGQTLDGRITTLEGQNLNTRVTANEAAITVLQSGTSCSTDMVAVGSLCVDLYEASVWSTAGGGTQYMAAGPITSHPPIPCFANGSDCGATAANPIYARSVGGVLPAARITWYQAAMACANVGKRLPTTAEWQMAASGTPAGTGPTCNATGGAGLIAFTDANPACISNTGAINMVGNVWEMTADLDNGATGFGSSDTLIVLSYGQDFSNSGGGTPSSTSTFGINTNDVAQGKVGFRCVR